MTASILWISATMTSHDLQLTKSTLLVERAGKAFGPEEADLVARAAHFAGRKLISDGNLAFSAAQLLLDQGADPLTVSVALLAPTVWNARAKLPEIGAIFGSNIAAAVSEFEPPTILRTDTETHRRCDLRCLLNSLANNTRQAILRIAWRVAELECALLSPNKCWDDKVQETLDVYVPIASRLGLGELRKRLEDVSFHILDAPAYEALENKVAPIRAEDEACLKILLEGVRLLLKNNEIQGQVEGRTKSLYSIHSKMIRTSASLDAIMDRIGLRIVVAKVAECYRVLGLVHTHFKPVPGTFDDYIGLPKENGYQSLHTCVYPVRDISRKPIEFQIRTRLMHIEAQYGAAAHWRYKTGTNGSERAASDSQWLKSLVGRHSKTHSSDEFIRMLKRQVQEDHLVVFGRSGLIAKLSVGTTVRDYLTRYHPDSSPELPARVNGMLVPPDHRLHDGDSIETLTDEEVGELGNSAF